MLEREDIAEIWSSFVRRCELVRLAGGIPLYEVVDGVKVVPLGWELDFATQFFIPPGLVLSDQVQ